MQRNNRNTGTDASVARTERKRFCFWFRENNNILWHNAERQQLIALLSTKYPKNNLQKRSKTSKKANK